jgi:hypothetical protein
LVFDNRTYAQRRKRRRPGLGLVDLARDIEARFGVSLSTAALRQALASRGASAA